VSFAAITLCVTSQRVLIVVVDFVMTQSGNFRIHPRKKLPLKFVMRRVNPLHTMKTSGGWRKLHGKDHRNLYSSPNIIRMTKSKDGWDM
jgi:hypothetical protein